MWLGHYGVFGGKSKTWKICFLFSGLLMFVELWLQLLCVPCRMESKVSEIFHVVCLLWMQASTISWQPSLILLNPVSCCKFWIYWVGVNTKFTTWHQSLSINSRVFFTDLDCQNLQMHCLPLYGLLNDFFCLSIYIQIKPGMK